MFKKLQLTLMVAMVLMLLVVSCAPKPSEPAVTPPEEAPTAIVEPTVPPTEEVPTTGEASVDEVATDILDSSNVDEELDTSELKDVDDILADIENI